MVPPHKAVRRTATRSGLSLEDDAMPLATYAAGNRLWRRDKRNEVVKGNEEQVKSKQNEEQAKRRASCKIKLYDEQTTLTKKKLIYTEC